jgi:dihydroxyacid dehydratase/phosphogluconate dehydratase
VAGDYQSTVGIPAENRKDLIIAPVTAKFEQFHLKWMKGNLIPRKSVWKSMKMKSKRKGVGEVSKVCCSQHHTLWLEVIVPV